MKYLSTRGSPQRLSFEEAVLSGLAVDGGLLIPASLPRLPSDWQEAWSSLSFPDLSLEVLSLFISPEEISRNELRDLIQASYSTFRTPEVAPLKQLSDKQYVLELFHGPTFAFKDVALQFLGNLFEFFLKRKNGNKQGKQRDRLTVVGATSGDTGSAAIYGLRNKQDISIFILHPKGRVSPIQEAQMTTVTDENVFNLAVEGTFDDCQDIVKALFSDTEFNSKYHLGAVNSINWARILAQIVYYFSSYFALLKSLNMSAETFTKQGLRIQYVVPTGNFGDILAGWFAKRLGLPMQQLVIATNENDILQRFWATGRYEKAATSESQDAQTEKVEGSSDGAQAQSAASVKATLAPAMDILVSSNFERLLWYYAFEQRAFDAVVDEAAGDVDGGASKRIEKAGATLKSWMSDLKTSGTVDVGVKVHEAAKREFSAQRVSDKDILTTISAYYESDKQYIVDPHTAIGMEAANREAQRNSANTIQIILATAHPAKFSSAVEDALKAKDSFNFETQVLPEEFKGLLEKERRVISVAGADPELTKKVIQKQLSGYFADADSSEMQGASV